MNKSLKIISRVAIGALKDLASQGKELSADSLLEKLESHEEIKAIEKEAAAREAVKEDPEKKALKKQAEKFQNRANQLLKEIDGIEQRQMDNETFFRKALLVLTMNIEPAGDQSLIASLDTMIKRLRENSEIQQLKDAFNSFKEKTVKDGIRAGEKQNEEKGDSLLARFFKGSDSKATEKGSPIKIRISHLKAAYQGIVDELRMNLGKKYIKPISEINIMIAESDNFESLDSARDKMLSLIQDFFNGLASERGVTAGFIRGIASRLAELETNIISSLDHEEKTLKAENEFNSTLEEHLKSLKNSVDYSKTLSELKEAVVSRLGMLNEAIETKSREDRVQRDEADKRYSRLKKNLNKLKKRIFESEKHTKTLEKDLLIDPLTRAYNRRAYDNRIKYEMNRFLRYGNIFSLLLFDVDHFKKINDTYGHAIGDKCLKEIIKRIHPALRKSDFLARFGGEEFMIILPETSRKKAGIAGEKIRKIVEKIEFLHKKNSVRITISVGGSEVAPLDKDHTGLFARVDQAMYKAKNSGRNKVVME